jgi:RNA polymerase sigma-70 factor (ECF subfamily)
MRALFARHQLRVYRFIVRTVRDETSAEDLVSNVLLDVWRQAAEYAARATVSTWLLAIARNKALSALRRHAEAALDSDVACAIVDPAADPEDALQDKERSALLSRCVAQLSTEHGQIIDLIYYHEKSVKEVAEIIGIPPATVKTRMFYARRKLAEMMKAA